MSYKRVLTGSFEIKPPLPWGAYRLLPQMDPDESSSVLKIVEDVQNIDQHEGQLVKRSAIGIVPSHEEAWDTPEHEIDSLALICADHGSALVGGIYAVGEDGPLDTWRYYTDADGRVVKDQAILVWPDGRRAYQAIPRSELPGQETLGGHALVLGSDGPMAWFSRIDPAQIITGPPWQR
jgi:hypothetical protein